MENAPNHHDENTQQYTGELEDLRTAHKYCVAGCVLLLMCVILTPRLIGYGDTHRGAGGILKLLIVLTTTSSLMTGILGVLLLLVACINPYASRRAHESHPEQPR